METSRVAHLRDLATRAVPEVAAYLARRRYPLSTADIEDLVEEVLEITWRRLDDIPLEAEVAWMIGVARNLLNNARRKHGRKRAFEARLLRPIDEPSAEDESIANLQLGATLNALRNADREILLLHYWEGQGAEELAVILGTSNGAAATRLSRATERFRSTYARLSEGSDKNLASRTGTS